MAAGRVSTGMVCFFGWLCYGLVVVDWIYWRYVMREIKFRSWNGERMQHGGFSINAAGNVLADSLHGAHPIAVMQYTGLKDANGVEIYEGDYVSIFTRDDNEYMMCGVVKFGFRGYPGFDIYTRGGNTYSDEYNTFTNDDDLYFKVVGNIYQNQELLK